MSIEILPVNKRGRTSTRNCRQCGAHFPGQHWQRWCRVCWSWRMVGWHIQAAQRALKVRQ
jgi:hypothetical protein